MDKRLIGYMVFSDCEGFMTWQKEHKDCDIIAVIPMVSSLKMQFEGQKSEARESAEGFTGIGAFVTFAYP